MGSITYIKGNILEAGDFPRILLHSCNCNGSWGGGIAYQLAMLYPDVEENYEESCERYGSGLLGKCQLIEAEKDDDLIIGCLFTAAFGGSDQNDSDILKYTKMALENFKSQLQQYPGLNSSKIIMPKINSGIFGVPWEETEKILKECDLNFTVYVI